MVLRLKSNVFVRKINFFVKNVFQKYEFFPEMTFFHEKKTPAAKLSHQQSKFSASPQDGIGHTKKKERKHVLHVQTALCMPRKQPKMKKVCFPFRNKKKTTKTKIQRFHAVHAVHAVHAGHGIACADRLVHVQKPTRNEKGLFSLQNKKKKRNRS